tara:strand:- start:57 stop:356 length:300 start_codon:yes stop_codon:yes gene_type:complete
MNIQFYEVNGSIDSKLIIKGYCTLLNRYFTTEICLTTDEVSSDENIIIKDGNKLYKITTTLINTILLDNQNDTIDFNYNYYNIPSYVYITMIGSIVTDL